MGNGNIKYSYVFFRIVLYSILFSIIFLPAIDYFLVKLGWKFDLQRVYSRIFLLIFFILFFREYIKKRQFFGFPVLTKSDFFVFFKFFIIGAFFISIVVLFQLLFDVRIFKGFFGISGNIGQLILFFFTGIIVGVLETYILWFFLFNLFEKDYGEKKAEIIVVFLFFISHFLKTQEVSRYEGVYVLKGVEVFIKSFYGLIDIKENLFYMIGIFLLGLFFTDLYVYTKKNFWVVSGIHSGAVFMIKANRIFFDFSKKNWEWLTGASTCIDGVLGWFFILLMILFLRKKRIKKSGIIL